ncbi:hypothetical protein D3OALGA1CA_4154 [Olavius algarvensis associated proteobacterium Delta 3]|nr:hypothetical protein D3OALGA1CA_4154 [Olavius algarvensis associated proteobacterium Delta 3]
MLNQYRVPNTQYPVPNTEYLKRANRLTGKRAHGHKIVSRFD